MSQLPGVQTVPNGNDNIKVYRLQAGSTDLQHHVMRVQSNKYDINALQPPIRLVRDIPKPRERRAAAPVEDGQPPREKMDTTKVAPWGGAVKSRQNLFKKKTRAFFHARQADEEVAGTEEMTHAERKRQRDPDRYKWLLSDFQGDSQGAHAPYYGEVESSQNGRYFLFMESESGMKVVPVTRHYKFAQKPAFNTVTSDQMEAMMKEAEKRSVRQDVWVMKKLGLETQADGEGGGSSSPGWSQRVNRGLGGSGARRQKEEREDIDYVDDFADDEEVHLGFNNQADQREAEERMMKGDEDDFDEEEQPKVKPDKKVKKALRAAQQSESDDDEDENPYISDQEESEEDAEKEGNETDKEKDGNDPLAPKAKEKKPKGRPPGPDKKAKAKTGSSTPSHTTSPARAGGSPSAVKREGGMSPKPAIGRPPTGARSPVGSSGARSPPVGRGGARSPRLAGARSPVQHAYAPAHPSPLGAGATSSAVRITLKVKEEPDLNPASGSGSSAGAGKRKAESPADNAANKKARQSVGAPTATVASPAQPRGVKRGQTGDAEVQNKKIKMEPGASGSLPSPAASTGRGGNATSPLAKGSAQSPPNKRLAVPKATIGGATGTGSPRTPGGTPAARLLTENDIIDVLKQNKGTMKVKDLVSALKPLLQAGEHSEANKTNMRLYMKRLAIHDRTAGIITLKPEYMPK
ncbi:hypothetical protein HK097_006572 [Rhizophlyctis rosea]|uniref:Transcription initiation factor IIF subunit alpha n=1 Tax=Rhizophlyctis rosea TaxID=64517 RepID=A0AAD5X229_9FUNG|nr:hypothetical protein HK097_006572 [Rhizophlyctis rosea]